MITDEFYKILKDFVKDIMITFPEYKDQLHMGMMSILADKKDGPGITEVVEHCTHVYPQRFFDILYQKEELFSGEAVYFIPNIDFCELWKLEISDQTRTIIWKYLQLVLFSVVKLEKEAETFGETAKLFEAIDEVELKKKLEQTIEQMSDLFDISGKNLDQDISNIPFPDAENLQNHINGMLEGNLGKLAREIAEETAQELSSDMKDSTSVGDIFKKLFRNPGKLMGLINKVGAKLDTKLQSGEMKESELIREASELIGKMHKMPGMSEMHNMLGEMGLPIGNSKINMNAFQAHMARNMKQATTKERLQRKLAKKRAAKKDKKRLKRIKKEIKKEEIVPSKKKKRRRKKRKNKK